MMTRLLLSAFIISALAAPCATAAPAKTNKQKQPAAKPAAPEAKPKEAAPAPAIPEEDQEDKNAPLNITSQRMVSEKKTNRISFYGSVVAIKGKLRVEADEIHVLSDKSQENLQEMEALGSVKITHKDKSATGQKAVYYGDSQTVILTGNPVMTQGKNVATGEKVIYHFAKEDMEIVSGQSQPASITLFPKADKTPAQGSAPPSVKK